jgi:hypothetical protein
MPNGIDENFTIRLLAPPVNAENEVELRRPTHKCYFRAARRRRKAEARRVERSESLDDVEHSSILIVVMADLRRDERREVR